MNFQRVNPPKIFASIKAGYNTLSRHPYIALFPFGLDMYLLFGHRITIQRSIQNFVIKMPFPNELPEDFIQGWEWLVDQVMLYFKYFSLTSVIRTLPFGIPSLFSFSAFSRSPIGEYEFINLSSAPSIILWLLVFTLIGLLLALVFFEIIARVVSKEKIELSLKSFIKKYLNVLGIPLLAMAIFAFIVFPGLMIVGLLAALVPFLASLGYIMLSMLIITISIPLIFTPHIIILENESFYKSALKSIRLTLPITSVTSLFFFTLFSISYITDLLWNLPKAGSWMLIIGAIGHSIISSITSTASFHYFLDASQAIPVTEDLKV